MNNSFIIGIAGGSGLLSSGDSGLEGELLCSKPLLDGDIAPWVEFWEEGASDNGICAVRTDYIFSIEGLLSCVGVIGVRNGNGKAVVRAGYGGAGAAPEEGNALRNKGYQPLVKHSAAEVEIKPLIIPCFAAVKVDGAHREYLRTHQQLSRQSEIKLCQCLLCIGSKQSAAGLVELVRCVAGGNVFFIHSGYFEGRGRVFRQKSCECCTRRSETYYYAVKQCDTSKNQNCLVLCSRMSREEKISFAVRKLWGVLPMSKTVIPMD